ncbi:elicitor-responsive protein 1-like [Cynara cardunculus var. scolymus]|uniref:elicitor-responsive protein 1-like n=1 Tax=Cynara cardunculus var. scolymus TaxID=59895 RepID=UPI000D62749B|nr:elicitor-responsive protein 1-like [Cynara cardunculus var. scolymus]
MTTHGIHGNLLEVTVVSCNKLKDTEWISRQDPYVCVEYGSNRSRTRTCTDGGKNPTFQEKFVYTLIEGLRELNVNVWNSNTLKHDNFIGSGKVQLAKAISQGFDDSTWPLQSKSGRHSGEVRMIIHYSSAHKPANNHAQSAQPFGTPQASLYSAPPPSVSYPPPASAAPYPPAGGYPAPSPYPSYPPNSAAYPPSPYPNSGAYPSSSSPYPPQASPYPQPYPPNSAYPPQPYGSHYPPGTPYPPAYPPRY